MIRPEFMWNLLCPQSLDPPCHEPESNLQSTIKNRQSSMVAPSERAETARLYSTRAGLCTRQKGATHVSTSRTDFQGIPA